MQKDITFHNSFSILTLFIYTAVAILSLFYQKENPFDFILDIIFISALIKSDIFYWDYVSILYLFPIFFSTLFIDRTYTILFPLGSLIIYGANLNLTGNYSFQEIALKLFLNGVAFFSIYFAGKAFEIKLKKQSNYILKLEEEKKKSDVFKRLYHISADLAHELKNPLASIKAAVELLSEQKKPNEKLLNLLKKETGRLANIINDFLMLSRPLDMQKSEISVIEMILSIIDTIKVIHPNKKVKLEIDTKNDIRLVVPYKSFFSAISNIIKNSFEWAQKAVTIKISENDNTVSIVIKDDGPGIKESNTEKIFEPFYTAKKSGSGLGLTIAKRVAIELGGNLSAINNSEGGAIFIFKIPKNQEIKR